MGPLFDDACLRFDAEAPAAAEGLGNMDAIQAQFELPAVADVRKLFFNLLIVLII